MTPEELIELYQGFAKSNREQAKWERLWSMLAKQAGHTAQAAEKEANAVEMEARATADDEFVALLSE